METEVIATLQSKVQARRVQDEIALQGVWKLTGGDENSVVYSRKRGDILEELIIQKKAERQWEVCKIEKEITKAK
jgi:hypothetical protein